MRSYFTYKYIYHNSRIHNVCTEYISTFVRTLGKKLFYIICHAYVKRIVLSVSPSVHHFVYQL